LSVYPTAANRIRLVKVERVQRESSSTATILFEDPLCSKAKPGQFAMIWAPSSEEVPMSISFAEKRMAGVSVERVGEATRALHKLKPGEFVGVRGPLGNHFRIVGGKTLVVGGGTGVASLQLLSRDLLRAGIPVTFAVGARSRTELLFRDTIVSAFNHPPHTVIATTEDGSYGLRGLVTDPLERVLREQVFSSIYTCGPEPMMRKIVEMGLRLKVPVQASLERIMKCGIGICGSCCLGPFMVCKDGPVFSSSQLRVVREFGLMRRDHSGKLIPL